MARTRDYIVARKFEANGFSFPIASESQSRTIAKRLVLGYLNFLHFRRIPLKLNTLDIRDIKEIVVVDEYLIFRKILSYLFNQ